MKQAFQDNSQNMFTKKEAVEKQSDEVRQYIFLSGKIYQISEMEGKIHVYL